MFHRSLLSLVCCSALCFLSIISAGKFSLYWLCKLGPESGKLTRGWNRGHTRGIFFFLFRFSCIQWNVYIFMYTINILLQTRELGDCTDTAQSLLSHFVLEEIHFLLFHTVLDKDKALHEWQIQGSEFLISWVLWKSNYLSRSLIVCLVVNSSMSWNCHLIGHEAQAMSEETPKVAMVRAFCPQLCNSALRKHPYVPVRPSKSRNKSASPTHLWSWPG